MKTLKKTISLFLSLVLVLCLFPCTAFASSSVLTIETVEGAQSGETVSINVNVSENLNAAMMQFSVSYDTNVLELTETQNGTLFAGLEAPTVNSSIAGHVFFCWDSVKGTITNAGTLLTLAFTVKTGASGKTAIKIDESEELVFCDAGYNDVTPQIVSGGVVFGGNAVTSITVSLDSETVKVGKTVQATAEVLPENASNKAVIWSISEGSQFAKIDSQSGVITGLSAGCADVRATTCDGSGIFGEATINVTDEIASGKCGNNLTWVLDSSGTLTISGTGEMDDYGSWQVYGDFSYSQPWSYNRTDIINVIIESGVTSIGYAAFWHCSNLESVTIADDLTNIRKRAFDCCSSLSSITVSENNNNYCSKDGVLFNKAGTELVCFPDKHQQETEYTIPSGVTTIGYGAFDDCSLLTSIKLPDGVTSIGENAFWYCSSLTSLNIPDSVTEISGFAFAGCSSLTDVYYTGTQEQWNKISFGESNDPLTSTATIHYSKFSVAYDANGGEGAPETDVKTADEPLTLSKNEPTRNGYTFLGWADTSTATEAQYQPGDSYTTDGDVTLYAVWLKNTVILNVSTNTEYRTLKEALAAAKKGETVKLLNDITNEEDIIVESGRTLDLNGHSITDARLIYANGTLIDSTSNHAGLIKAIAYMFNDVKEINVGGSVNNKYLPIYDNDAGGYRLVGLRLAKDWPNLSSGNKVDFALVNSIYSDYAYALLANNPNHNKQFKAYITVSWTQNSGIDSQGNELAIQVTQEFLYNDVFMDDIIKNNKTRHFAATVDAVKDSTLIIQPKFVACENETGNKLLTIYGPQYTLQG